MSDLKKLESIFKYDAELDDTYGDLNTKELEAEGVTNIDITDGEEDIGSFSTDVTWYRSLEVTFNDKRYRVYMSGTAIAEISYDRWCSSFGYSIDEDSVSINEIKEVM